MSHEAYRSSNTRRSVMIRIATSKKVLGVTLAAVAMILLSTAPAALQAADGAKKEKTKVLYHVDGKDPEVAKYALALINKHIDAEGGPENIDVELVAWVEVVARCNSGSPSKSM